MNDYLKETYFIDSKNEKIIETANKIIGYSKKDKEKSIKLFYFVRDKITYNPYSPFENREDYIASVILERGYGYCIQKAVLLTTLLRSVNIPSRLVFVDIKNYKAPETLTKFFGNLFMFHGYCEIYINDKWIKATPTFNIEMCEKFGYKPTEFDGENDALLEKYNRDGELTFEYVNFRGIYSDLPYNEIISTYKSCLGDEKLNIWKKLIEEKNDKAIG